MNIPPILSTPDELEKYNPEVIGGIFEYFSVSDKIPKKDRAFQTWEKL